VPVDNQGQRSCFKGTSPAYGPGQEFHNRGQRDLGIEADARITRNVSYDPPVVISPQDQREVPDFCVGGADFWTRNHVTDFGGFEPPAGLCWALEGDWLRGVCEGGGP
jgi:hypothetical protein